MNRVYWTVPEAVDLLAEAHWVDLGGQGLDPDPITLEALAWALDGHPESREQVWNAWEGELIPVECSLERGDEAPDRLTNVMRVYSRYGTLSSYGHRKRCRRRRTNLPSELRFSM